MLTRIELYRRLACRFPPLWKPLRILLYGKYDFNNLEEWNQIYSEIDLNEIEFMNNRIPNLINKALLLVVDYESVLEISAGFGNFITKLNCEEKSLFATEYSDVAVEYLNTHGIHAIQAKLPELSYGNKSVDIIVSISVFEH